ncbi:MAG: HAD family hydrolase [Bacillota bacterium]
MITTYIFDLDDTLIPYDPREQRAYALLAAAGADTERTRAMNLSLWPEVAIGRLPIEEKWRREALAGGVAAEVAERFVAALVDFDPAYEDALPVLERLAAAGTRLAIITNGPPGDHQRAKLRKTGLDRFFGDFVFISSEVGAAKPDPRIFHHALEALGVTPAESLYVGDKAEHDAAAAAAVGMQGVWLDRRGSSSPAPAGVRRITTLTQL